MPEKWKRFAGQIGLGLALLAVGLFVLAPLRWIERRFVDERRATLTLFLAQDGPSEDELRGALVASGMTLGRVAISRQREAHVRTFELDVRWLCRDERTPGVIGELAARPGVDGIRWDPKS